MTFDCNFIVWDVETGGLKADDNPIVEIAMISLDNSLNETGRYESLIKPYDSKLKIQEQALQANGLTMDQINSGKDASIVAVEIINFFRINKRGKELPVLCGHNIDNFDIPFLVNFLTFHKLDLFNFINDKITIDTMWWSRLKWQESVNYKLGTCCQNAGIDLTNAHRAMTDTVANAELVKVLISSLRGSSKIVSKGENSAEVELVGENTFREQFQF